MHPSSEHKGVYVMDPWVPIFPGFSELFENTQKQKQSNEAGWRKQRKKKKKKTTYIQGTKQ